MIQDDIISKIVSGDFSDPKAAIMKTAIEEFALRSLDGARTRAIAEKSGSNIAAINYHFGSKRRLYEAVILHISRYFDSYIAPYYDEGARIIAAQKAQTAKKFIQKFLIDCIRKFSEIGIVSPFCEILSRESASPSEFFKPAYESLYERPVAFIAKLLETASKEKIQPDMGIVFAHSLWANVRDYSSKSEAIMRLHSWKKFGEREIKILEDSLQKVLEKTLK